MANEIRHHLRVIAFFDGRPGHEKQTRGILQALQKETDIEVTEVSLQRQGAWQTARELFYLFSPFKQRTDTNFPEADLLLGTGSQTHFPMLKIKKLTGCPAVICMTPMSFLQNKFDLIFVPEHDGVAARENIVITIGPPNNAPIVGEKKADRGLILIGGADPKSHFWDTDAIEEALRQITRKENSVTWTLSSSPRTPPDTVERLDKLARQIDNLHFFRYEDTASGWVEKQYAECRTVWVTADSMSMVYEALTAGCQVGILAVRWKNEKNKFKRSEEYLIRNNLAVSYLQWLSGNEVWPTGKPLNEARHCAQEILKRWRPENSQ